MLFLKLDIVLQEVRPNMLQFSYILTASASGRFPIMFAYFFFLFPEPLSVSRIDLSVLGFVFHILSYLVLEKLHKYTKSFGCIYSCSFICYHISSRFLLDFLAQNNYIYIVFSNPKSQARNLVKHLAKSLVEIFLGKKSGAAQNI